MKILMFGWEFPPHNLGGLGTACHGLVHGLISHGNEIFLVLPQNMRAHAHHPKLAFVNPYEKIYKSKKLIQFPVNSSLLPYQNAAKYEVFVQDIQTKNENNTHLYGKDIFAEVARYANKAHDISKKTPHEVIHSHDWMTYPAGELAKKSSDKGLVVHVHATEFDRTGGNPNQQIYNLEQKGMNAADRIIAVSDYTKKKIIENYGISEHKIKVVHNAVMKFQSYFDKHPKLKTNDKIVLFLGRITLQKGPEYFVDMANKVLQKYKKVKFVMAGTGDMMEFVINRAAKYGIAKNFLFTGFLKGEDVDKVYQMADLYIMPSVSEPFGITPLEAIKNGTPVLISKQSGVSEVIQNALKVDFWDIDEMANKVLAALTYPALPKTLLKLSKGELNKMSWEKQAGKVHEVYQNLKKF